MPIQTRTTYLPVYTTSNKYVYLRCPVCEKGRLLPDDGPSYDEVDDGHPVRITFVSCNNEVCRSNTATVPHGEAAFHIEVRVYGRTALIVEVTETHQ